MAVGIAAGINAAGSGAAAVAQVWLMLQPCSLLMPRQLAAAEDWLHQLPELFQHVLQLLVIHGICLGDHQCCWDLQSYSHSQVLPRDAGDTRHRIHTQEGVV